MSRINRRTALLGLAGAGIAMTGFAGSALAGYIGGEAPSGAPPVPPSPSPSPPGPVPDPTPTPEVDTRPRWPLTGRLRRDLARAPHAAIAVKVPDNENEHPQRGLDEADIVFVELDGYRDAAGHSGTRLLPVFHSRLPETVGPVRSIRPVDIPLLSPLNALIGNTGAAPWVVNYVRHYRRHLEGLLSYLNTKGTGSYGTDPSRVRVYQGQTYYDRATICHPRVLARQTKRFRAGPQGPYFPFVTSPEQVSTVQGGPARTVQVPYQGDSYRMRYDYDPKTKRYRRSMPWGPHVLADGTRVTTDNVLVIKAKLTYGKLFHGGGHDEPLHDVINASGTFFYAYRGRYVRGRWTKGKVETGFVFTLDDGSPLAMGSGQTFVELPDTDAKIRFSD